MNVQDHPVCPTFPLWTFRKFVQLQHVLHHKQSAHTLELLFRSLLVESSKRVCLVLGSKHVVLPTDSTCFSTEDLGSRGGFDEIGP